MLMSNYVKYILPKIIMIRISAVIKQPYFLQHKSTDWYIDMPYTVAFLYIKYFTCSLLCTCLYSVKLKPDCGYMSTTSIFYT